MASNYRVLAAVVVVLAAVAGGALYLGISVEQGSPDPDALRERVTERNASIDAYKATVEVTVDRGDDNDTRRIAYRVATDRSGRLNVTYTAPKDRRGDVFLVNRSGGYFYDRDRGRLIRRDAPDSNEGLLTTLVGVVTDGNGSFRGEDRIEGSSGVVLRYSAGGGDVALRIGGSPPASQFAVPDEANATATSVWVDPKLDLPVRLRQRYRGGESNTTLTVRITDLKVVSGFEAGQFRFAPPSGTEVVDRTGRRRFDSRAALRRNVSLSLPAPSIPSSFSFARGIAVGPPDNRTVALVYESGIGSILVSKHRPAHPVEKRGDRVAVGGTDGYYHASGASATLRWRCGGATYSVSGTVGRETILSVARSVGCP